MRIAVRSSFPNLETSSAARPSLMNETVLWQNLSQNYLDIDHSPTINTTPNYTIPKLLGSYDNTADSGENPCPASISRQ